MVTAGVYLLMRHSPLIEYSSTGLMIIALLGGFSALLGAAGGLLENDMKRVIAFSTTSQLGYMMVCIGIEDLVMDYKSATMLRRMPQELRFLFNLLYAGILYPS